MAGRVETNLGITISTFCPCDLSNPDFKNTTRVHDWRNYVPYSMQKIWSELPLESKVIIVIMAERDAMAEEWD